jgi:hypothetical protein
LREFTLAPEEMDHGSRFCTESEPAASHVARPVGGEIRDLSVMGALPPGTTVEARWAANCYRGRPTVAAIFWYRGSDANGWK